jgi:hypothetical protein
VTKSQGHSDKGTKLSFRKGLEPKIELEMELGRDKDKVTKGQ